MNRRLLVALFTFSGIPLLVGYGALAANQTAVARPSLLTGGVFSAVTLLYMGLTHAQP